MRLVLVLSLVWVAACQSGGAPEPVTTTTDSAGITIVTNLGPQWGEGEGWRLSEVPVLDLGTFDLEGPESFERVTGARRLSSGVVVVAEGGAQELRFFDESGSHIRTVGRQGNGPGEFQSLRLLELWRGDSLIVHDGRGQPVSLFDSTGVFGRSFRLEPNDSVRFPFSVGTLAGGELVTQGYERREEAPADGVTRQAMPLQKFDLVGAFIGHGPRFDGNEWYVVAMGDDGFAVGELRFGDGIRLGVGLADLIAIPTHRAELTWYPSGGRAVGRIARWPAKSRPVTDAEWGRHLDERTSNPQTPESIRRAFLGMPRAKTMPLVDGIVVDDDGNVWVRDFRSPLDTTSSLTVLSAEGELLGRMMVPFRFRPRHIGADFVLGTWEDEDDIPHVQMYQLIK